MKLTLNNIGPIHKFEFDLEKDIHLIYGKNNVGKSYAVNFLYCFLKALNEEVDSHYFASVAEQLYNERLEIYHQLNEEQDAYHTTEK